MRSRVFVIYYLVLLLTISIGATELSQNGWNLVGNCQDINREDINMTGIDEIQDQEGKSIYAGDFAKYSNLDILYAGYGYWVKGNINVTFDSGGSNGKLIKPLRREGWNLMASCENLNLTDFNISNFEEIQNQNGNSVSSTTLADSSNFDKLIYGHGYWIKGDKDIPWVPKRELGFIHRQGNRLIARDGIHPLQLRGVNFTPYYLQFWEADPSKLIFYEHHSEADFKKLVDMGMNVIRLHVTSEIFEDFENPYTYKEEAWAWMESHILSWARKYNIYVIININVPPGYDRNGDKVPREETDEYYEHGERRERLKALWKEIARRYANEPIIAGYDLINEPHIESDITYKELLEEIISDIRTVDNEHLIIVEHNHLSNTFMTVNDDNVLYDFHFYYPLEYTYQTYDNLYPEYGSYPNEMRDQFPNDLEDLDYRSTDNLNYDSNWTLLESSLYTVLDSSIILAEPILFSGNNSGIVYYDNIVVSEYDENSNFIRNVIDEDITESTTFYQTTWQSWSTSAETVFHYEVLEGYNNGYSLSISNSGSSSSWYNHGLRFPTVQGHKYKVSARVKGSNVSVNSENSVGLSFQKSSSGMIIQKFNKEYLKTLLQNYIKFGIDNNVPLNIGEFGSVNINYFKDGLLVQNAYGTLTYIHDLIDIFNSYYLNFTYYGYHESMFGIYGYADNQWEEWEGPPNKRYFNRELYYLFKRKLNNHSF